MRDLKKKNFIKVVAVLLVAVCVVGVMINKNMFKSKASGEDYIADKRKVESINENINIQEIYDNLDSSIFDKYRAMDEEQINDLEQQISLSYNEGDILSEEDQYFILFLQCEYDKNHIAEDFIPERLWTTRKYKIKNSKTKCGVTASYEGYLETWAGSQHSKYGGNVKVKLSKSVKSAKFTIHHTEYGVLGWNGHMPTIGVVYSGSISSDSYKKSFSYNEMKKYSAIWPVRASIWGDLKIKTSSGEFTLNTKTYKHFE